MYVNCSGRVNRIMRNSKIDTIKGLCIIFVIVAHVSSYLISQRNLPFNNLPDALSLADLFWIILRNSIDFMIAGFLFISGYCLTRVYGDKDSFKVVLFYKKRLKRIYIPFVVWLTIYTLVWGHPSIYNTIISLAFLGGWFHFWFLWVIFVSYLLFPYLLHQIRSNLIVFSLIFLIVLAFSFLLSDVSISSSYTLNFILHDKILILPQYVLYFCVGVICGVRFQKDIFSFRMNYLSFFLLVFIYSISFYGKMHKLSDISYTANYLNACCSILFNSVSILFLLRVVAFIETRFNKLGAFLSVMGVSSYGIYLSHMAIIYICGNIIDEYFHRDSSLYALVTFLSCVLSSYLLARLITNKKLCMLLGFECIKSQKLTTQYVDLQLES